MQKEISLREATDNYKQFFIRMAVELARYNRRHHNEACRQDEFEKVLEAIEKKAEHTFEHRDDNVLVLIAFLKSKPVGYALGRIYYEEDTADNGTGRTGLFDELYVDESVRGKGIGQMLTDGITNWMKTKNIYRIKLHAYAWNKAAQNLYKRNGFNRYASSYEKFI